MTLPVIFIALIKLIMWLKDFVFKAWCVCVYIYIYIYMSVAREETYLLDQSV